jgi:hypothetical protein
LLETSVKADLELKNWLVKAQKKTVDEKNSYDGSSPVASIVTSAKSPGKAKRAAMMVASASEVNTEVEVRLERMFWAALNGASAIATLFECGLQDALVQTQDVDEEKTQTSQGDVGQQQQASFGWNSSQAKRAEESAAVTNRLMAVQEAMTTVNMIDHRQSANKEAVPLSSLALMSSLSLTTHSSSSSSASSSTSSPTSLTFDQFKSWVEVVVAVSSAAKNQKKALKKNPRLHEQKQQSESTSGAQSIDDPSAKKELSQPVLELFLRPSDRADLLLVQKQRTKAQQVRNYGEKCTTFIFNL